MQLLVEFSAGKNHFFINTRGNLQTSFTNTGFCEPQNNNDNKDFNQLYVTNLSSLRRDAIGIIDYYHNEAREFIWSGFLV